MSILEIYNETFRDLLGEPGDPPVMLKDIGSEGLKIDNEGSFRNADAEGNVLSSTFILFFCLLLSCGAKLSKNGNFLHCGCIWILSNR